RVDADPGRRHLLLCPARRLRPGRGHALQLHAGHAIPQSRDERDCARMGRQRDLAGAGRRRVACGLSACLRHPHPGALFSDPGHAAGAGVSRRRLRVPLSRCRAQDLLGSWLLLRLADRNAGPGHDARRLHPVLQGRGPRLCRRPARFLDAVLGSHRHCAGLRLRAPGRRLAGAQDRGRHPGAGAPLWPRLPGGCGDRDRGGESMDAAGERCRLHPLVLLAEHPHSVAGAHRERFGCLGHVAGIERCVAVWRLHRRNRPVRAFLYRHDHQPLPDDRAASLYADAGRRPAPPAGVSPRRHAVPAAGDPLLLGLVVLGVPRQGARRCELSVSSRREVGGTRERFGRALRHWISGKEREISSTLHGGTVPTRYWASELQRYLAWSPALLGGVVALLGLILAVGGAYLAWLGGSLYYVLVGAMLVAAGYLLIKGRIAGFYSYVGGFAFTAAWSFWEVGLSGWQLIPRLVGPFVLLVLAILIAPALDQTTGRRARKWGLVGAGIFVV